MKKSEVIKAGHWPAFFLEDLISEVPPITYSSGNKLKWCCKIHGPYDQQVSSKLNGHGCPLCGKESGRRNQAMTKRQKNPFPQWFIDDLEGSPDKELVLNHIKSVNDKAIFICKIHGPYEQEINSHLQGHRCPTCGFDRTGKDVQLRMRQKNPFPQWFIDDLEGSPDKELVLNGTLKMQDKAIFVCSKHGTYNQRLYTHLAGSSCPTCGMQNGYKSKREIMIFEWLKSLNINVIQTKRGEIFSKENGYPMEMDIYLPDYQVAFEFNGYFWHRTADDCKSKNYHKLKTETALENGIKLYHLWEDCSDDMVKSIIESKLNLTYRIYARKCSVQELSNGDFFKENHVDGNCRSIKRWGLFYNNECYAAISLRMTSDGHPEIARFCNKKHFTVVGGYSKLLKVMVSFLKENNYTELLTYCNRDLSPDPLNNFYSNHGFTLMRECSLIMKYFSIGKFDLKGTSFSVGIYPRQVFQKRNLRGVVSDEEYKALSEQEILKRLGVYPVYNSGNFLYRIQI